MRNNHSALSQDEVVANVLAEIDGLDPDAARLVVERYCMETPQHADAIRQVVSLDQLLSTAPDDVRPPDRLGDFRIVREIDRGGMGIVYEAVQDPLDRRVAVKVVQQRLLTQKARQRFQREQLVLARLHQSNIVPVFAAGVEGQLDYFAMPFIDGVSLREVVAEVRASREDKKAPPIGDTARRLTDRRTPAEGDNARPSVPPATLSAEDDTPAELAEEETVDQASPPSSAVPSVGEGEPQVDRRPLSNAYFRSAAKLMAELADATQHAHTISILHRDIKPANVMVDRGGQAWMIDFGLSQHQGLAAAERGAGAAEEQQTAILATTIGGTIPYMAPEQFCGDADGRTDVWGLGATLYELIALQPPLETAKTRSLQSQLQRGHIERDSEEFDTIRPQPIDRIVGNVPDDLAAICRKALSSDADARYQTPAQFAEDLRSWLNDEPTKARPWSRRKLARRLVKRHKLAVTAVAAVIIGIFGVLTAFAMMVLNEASETKRTLHLLRGKEVVKREHAGGWADEAMSHFRQAMAVRSSAEVRDAVVSTLADLDAEVLKKFPHSASRIAFDGSGKRLLLSSLQGDTVLWNDKDESTTWNVRAAGPVAFDRRDDPIQLVVRDGSLQLLDFPDRPRVRRSLSLPDRATPLNAVPAEPHNERWALPLAAVSAPAALAAVAIEREGNSEILVWQWSREDSFQLPAERAASLAFSHDGKLLAAGDGRGRIDVWSIERRQRLLRLRGDEASVQALAFGRAVRFRAPQPADGERPQGGLLKGWLLGAGDDEGQVVVWNLERAIPQAYCQGSMHEIRALAFSPDGMTMASCGRAEARLWDPATGEFLLRVGGARYSDDLAFSPSGEKLVVGNRSKTVSDVDAPRLWTLRRNRGIRVMRGLRGAAAVVEFSPGGSLLAALSHQWEVAVWDLQRDRLKCVIHVPRGSYVDNVSLRFSPQEQQLAVSSGKVATLWDLNTGSLAGRWTLPSGLQDNLIFSGPGGNLSVFRYETRSGTAQPGSESPWETDPRVCRLYQLALGEPPKQLWQIDDFRQHIYRAAAASDGTTMVITGLQGDTPEDSSVSAAYDGLTGELLWQEIHDKHNSTQILFDSTNAALFIHSSDYRAVLNPRNGDETERPPVGLRCLSNGAILRATSEGDLISLWRRGDQSRLVVLDDWDPTSERANFDATDTLLAWPKRDGSVRVADIQKIRRSLAKHGIGW